MTLLILSKLAYFQIIIQKLLRRWQGLGPNLFEFVSKIVQFKKVINGMEKV